MGAQRTPSSSWRGTRPRARTLSTPCSSTKRGQRRKGALISHASSTNAMYSVRCRRDFLSLAVYLRRSPRPGHICRRRHATVCSALTLTRQQVSLCACCVEKAFLALTAHETMVAHSVAHMDAWSGPHARTCGTRPTGCTGTGVVRYPSTTLVHVHVPRRVPRAAGRASRADARHNADDAFFAERPTWDVTSCVAARHF